jgi:hypothetical protein
MSKILLVGCFISETEATSITVKSFFSSYNLEQFVIVSTHHDILLYKNDAFVQKLVSLGQVWDLSNNSIFSWDYSTKNVSVQNKSFNLKIRKVVIDVLCLFKVNDILIPSKITKELLYYLYRQNVVLIYSPLSNYFLVKEVWFLQKFLNLNTIIHFFDNWLEEMELQLEKNILKRFLARKWFKRIFQFNGAYFCISEQMQTAYKKRYNIDSKVFFNTVELDDYYENSSSNSTSIKIGYFGRIGRGNFNAITQFSRAISEIPSNSEYAIILDLYFNSAEVKFPEFNNVKVCKSIKYDNVLQKMREYDFLFLPLDDVQESSLFIKYSIPTKFTDYASSGIPIISFGPSNNAVNRIILKNNLAFFIPYTENIYTLKAGISTIVESKSKHDVAFNAFQYVKFNFSKEGKMKEVINVIDSLIVKIISN